MNTAHNPPSEAGAQPGRLPADRIQAIAREIASAAHIPGISISVATPDKVLYAGAVGYSDLARRRLAQPEDQYLRFSMTKIATATAAMRLHADGLLDLDAPIGTYLPRYRPHPRHGHPGKHGTPHKTVGTRAAYSNVGYLLAGEVMQAATGRPVEDCVHDLVLNPLGMTATGYCYDRAAPRAVGYVRVARGLRPVLVRMLPKGSSDRRSGGTPACTRSWSTAPRTGVSSAPPPTPHGWPRHTPPRSWIRTRS